MSGRKTFTAGEVLQAADVNDYLMDQSVMVFAGTAARGSAIPSPSEGMVTYLADADELQVYTTEWGAVTGGGLVATHYVEKSDTSTFSVTAGNNVAVTGLSTAVAVSDAANKLIITAFFGVAATNEQRGRVGIAVSDGSNLLSIGAADGSKTQVTAGGAVSAGASGAVTTMPHITIVHTPGNTTPKTYSVHAINLSTGTQTLYINRIEATTDTAEAPRGVSALLIEEVSV